VFLHSELKTMLEAAARSEATFANITNLCTPRIAWAIAARSVEIVKLVWSRVEIVSKSSLNPISCFFAPEMVTLAVGCNDGVRWIGFNSVGAAGLLV
jgi:hypothetical protein